MGNHQVKESAFDRHGGTTTHRGETPIALVDEEGQEERHETTDNRNRGCLKGGNLGGLVEVHNRKTFKFLIYWPQFPGQA